jgi:hypothetical protein
MNEYMNIFIRTITISILSTGFDPLILAAVIMNTTISRDVMPRISFVNKV